MTRWLHLFPICLSLLMARVGVAGHLVTTAQEFDLESDYMAGAQTRALGSDVGSIVEFSTDARYAISPQINKRVLLRLGAEWQRTDFDVSNRAPLPDTLQQASLIIGVDCQLTDQWILRAEFEPGLYSDFKDVNSRDVDAPFSLIAAYVVDADFQWFAGFHVDLNSQYPLWPALGMRWKFADEWTLNLMLPRPRLEYDVNERLKLYVGGRVKAGTYRVGDEFGTDHGRPQLNHALLDQYELRVGPGISWKLRRNMTIEMDGGYMVYREFNFHDHHVVLRSEPAPYGQIAWHVRF